MKQRKHFMEQLTAATDLQDEPIPGLPLIEIAGDRRVLIEHHCGVTEYGDCKVGVKVKYGCILVCGNDLELSRMTKDQLIICGRIEAVKLIRRGV